VCVAAVAGAALAGSVAAPHDARAVSPEVGGGQKNARPRVPTRLWYRVTVNFKWDHRSEDVWRNSARREVVTSKGNWVVRTPPEEEQEAVLVRRTPGTGAVRFGRLGGLAVGVLVKSGWKAEQTFTGLNAGEPMCDPATTMHEEKLQGQAPVTAIVTLTSKGFGRNVEADGGTAIHSPLTGAVTCDPCPGSHPYVGARPEYVGGTSFACRFTPSWKPFERRPIADVPYRHLGLRNLIGSMHRFRLPRFGGARMEASSTASSSVKYPTTRDGRVVDITESATETVKFSFQRCPGRGRRPC
jgi:hypothetical protein